MNGRFDSVKYDEISVEIQETFKHLFEDIEEFSIASLPDSRARSLLLTALEEAYMWSGKAIRDEQVRRMGSPHTPERSEA